MSTCKFAVDKKLIELPGQQSNLLTWQNLANDMNDICQQTILICWLLTRVLYYSKLIRNLQSLGIHHWNSNKSDNFMAHSAIAIHVSFFISQYVYLHSSSVTMLSSLTDTCKAAWLQFSISCQVLNWLLAYCNSDTVSQMRAWLCKH